MEIGSIYNLTEVANGEKFQTNKNPWNPWFSSPIAPLQEFNFGDPGDQL